MTRYIMMPTTYNRFKTMGYNLFCKICNSPIHIGDKVESKTGGKGPKLYHADCYDESHLDRGDNGILRNGLGNIIGEKNEIG